MGLRSVTPISVLLVVTATLVSCRPESDRRPEPADAPDERVGSAGRGDADWFVDRAAETGLDFIHINGMSGRFYQPEISGSGAAVFDYDNDGDLDVWLVQGGTLNPGHAPNTGATPEVAAGGRLYRNDLEIRADGSRTLRFVDVTNASRIVARGYGQGVAVGDFDNDGWIDLYLTGFQRNQMFRNNGDGSFSDVSAQTGTGSPTSWGVSAAFVDVDRDGWLDLFVGNYLTYSLETHVRCFMESGQEDYCAPARYGPQRDRFYRNRGNGTFLDATAAAGMDREFGPALGVSTADFNGDGWIDIFVANDQRENQLWINRGDGTFANRALAAGVALDGAGVAKADMGVDAGDVDNDGDEDLITTVLTREGNTLYINDGHGLFEDRSMASGVTAASRPYTGWGVGWIDVDNDGWLDLLAVNGLVKQDLDARSPDNPFPYQQRNQLLRNLGNGRFEDVTDRAGQVFALTETSRGAAFGDIDNDGDEDVLITNSGGPARLLINGIGTRHHWLGLRLVGGRTRRDMVGARVAVFRTDGPPLWRRARSDGSYASSNDPRVVVGLGTSARASGVRVIWPSGRTEEWTDVPVDRYTTLVEGTGR
ncbi:MAG: CRTAC1 family protein [Acidimicrobiia bacterium]|nr:CRTAC1 family protein [Acidimicrobiia bacterium]